MPQVEWKLLHPRATMAHLGALPNFLHQEDPAPAAEQLDKGYAFAGGWSPQKGFKLTGGNSLLYPGDPPMRPIAEAKLRDETICVYDSSYVAVIQPDRSFEVCRMD